MFLETAIIALASVCLSKCMHTCQCLGSWLEHGFLMPVYVYSRTDLYLVSMKMKLLFIAMNIPRLWALPLYDALYVCIAGMSGMRCVHGRFA